MCRGREEEVSSRHPAQADLHPSAGRTGWSGASPRRGQIDRKQFHGLDRRAGVGCACGRGRQSALSIHHALPPSWRWPQSGVGFRLQWRCEEPAPLSEQDRGRYSSLLALISASSLLMPLCSQPCLALLRLHTTLTAFCAFHYDHILVAL